MDIKEALTFDGLKYFYTKYIKPLKTGAFSTVVNNATTTVANTVLDGRMGKTLADKDANLQNQIDTLNSSLIYVNADFQNDGSSFEKNFQSIGLGDPKSAKNKTAYFIIKADEQTSWKNVPNGLITTSVSVGLREVFRVSGTIIMVKITEIHPKPGTQYFRTYNNGIWNDSGWNVIMPQ